MACVSRKTVALAFLARCAVCYNLKLWNRPLEGHLRPVFPRIEKASQEVLLLEACNPRVCECVLALVFLLFLRSLLLGCHEVFPSVDVFPLQGFLISRGP